MTVISPRYSFTLSRTNCLLQARVKEQRAGLTAASPGSTARSSPCACSEGVPSRFLQHDLVQSLLLTAR